LVKCDRCGNPLIRPGWPFYLSTPERALCGPCLDAELRRQMQQRIGALVGNGYKASRSEGVPVASSSP